MEQESDYILREVKRITAFLSKLITDFGGLENDDFESEIKASDDFIRQEWNISLQEIATITEVELSEKLEGLPEIHLEKLAELLSEIIKRINTPALGQQYNKKELAIKGLHLIKCINEKSKVYSMKRAEIKKLLQKFK